MSINQGGTAVRWTSFVLLGLAFYGGLYAASEALVHRYAKRNRFYMVNTAPLPHYDTIMLGASHAAVFDFEDMNARLEALTGKTVLNLSIVGAGVTVNRLVLDYFLARHRASRVIYVTDSFAFYSPQWNEERLNDTRLLSRAPLDFTLAGLLLKDRATRSTGLGYLGGFAKINNPDRFNPDVSEDEATRFNRTYRPVRQLDRERIAYLYPASLDERQKRHYIAQFEDLIQKTTERGIRFVIVRPPLPERIYRMIPGEESFDQDLSAVAARHGVRIHDFSLKCNDERFFFDTDHLNRSGVLNFFEHCVRDAFSGP